MLRKFIWSFSRLGDLESANASLKHLVMFARQDSACLSKSASGQYRSSFLDIPIPSKDKLCEKLLLDNSTSLTHSVNPEKSVGLEASLERLDMRHNNVNRNLELEKNFDGQSRSDKVDTPLSGTLIDQLISKSGKSNSISEAHEIIDDAVLNDLSFEDKQDGFCDPRTENMKQISKRFSRPLMNLLRWSFNDIIHACAEMNNYQLAEQLFLQVQSFVIRLLLLYFNFLAVKVFAAFASLDVIFLLLCIHLPSIDYFSSKCHKIFYLRHMFLI